jgi:hypothetical protein
MSVRARHALLLLWLARCGAADDPSGVPSRDAGALVDSGIQLQDGGTSSDAGLADAGPSVPVMPTLGAQIDRAGRPAISTMLIGPLLAESTQGPVRDAYNMAGRTAFPIARQPIAESLAIYDGIDGLCGNQLLADPNPIPERYFALATILADDRLYLNSDSVECLQFLAVELAENGAGPYFATDCGGRAPDYDVMDCLYSTLVIGSWTGVSDGVNEDNFPPTPMTFPFLAPPD